MTRAVLLAAAVVTLDLSRPAVRVFRDRDGLPENAKDHAIDETAHSTHPPLTLPT